MIELIPSYRIGHYAGGSTFTGYTKVANFAALPAANLHNGEIYIVLATTGVPFISYRKKGFYYSDGVNWIVVEDISAIETLRTDNLTIGALSGVLKATAGLISGSADHNDLLNRDAAGNHASITPSADSTTAFRVFKADGTTAMMTFDSTNNEIETTAPVKALYTGDYSLYGDTPLATTMATTDALNVGRVVSTGSGRGGIFFAEGTHTVNTSNALQGLNAVARTIVGVSTANYTSSSSGGGLRNRYQVIHAGTGTVTLASAVSSQITSGESGATPASTITSAIGFGAESPTINTNATINVFASFYARGGSVTGSLPNRYGLYIEDLVGGTTRYGIYQAGATDKNYLAGNLGIGDTSPVTGFVLNSGSGFFKTSHDSITNATTFTNLTGNPDGLLLSYDAATDIGRITCVDGGTAYNQLAIQASTLSVVTGAATLTEKFTVSSDTSGRIGINTSAPISTLHISGLIDNTFPTITLQRNDTTVATTNTYGIIQWYSNDTDHSSGNICASIQAVANGSQAGVYPKSDITISTANGTTDNVERFRFYSDGRFAQGTSASTTVGATFAREMTGGTTQYNIYAGATVKSDVTANAYNFISAPLTEAASFALSIMYHYSLLNPSIGSGSSITNQIGYHVPSTMTGATNNYAFYGALADAANRWNLYMAGTADNYLAGSLGIGVTDPAMLLDIYGTGSTTGVQATRYTATGSAAPYFNFRRSRGTLASPLVVNQNDNLGLFYFYGWKDAGARDAEWVPAAGFGGGVENDSAADHLVKGFIYFKTNSVGDFSTDGTERMRISNAGYLGVNVTAPTALIHAGASTTARASFCMNAGTAPTTPVSGDMWNDSTQQCIRSQSSGITKSLSGVIFTQTASATVGNTTDETSVVGTGVGVTLLPANFWTVGKTIRLKVYGHISCTASDTASVRVKVGSVTVGSSIDDAFPVTLTNSLFIGEVLMTCRTTGATGTLFVQGYTTIYASSSADMTTYGRQIVSTATVTIDTTATGQLNATYQWSAARAGNTITSTNSTIEVLN